MKYEMYEIYETWNIHSRFWWWWWWWWWCRPRVVAVIIQNHKSKADEKSKKKKEAVCKLVGLLVHQQMNLTYKFVSIKTPSAFYGIFQKRRCQLMFTPPSIRVIAKNRDFFTKFPKFPKCFTRASYGKLRGIHLLSWICSETIIYWRFQRFQS